MGGQSFLLVSPKQAMLGWSVAGCVLCTAADLEACAASGREEVGLGAHDGPVDMVFLPLAGYHEIRVSPAGVEPGRMALSTSASSKYEEDTNLKHGGTMSETVKPSYSFREIMKSLEGSSSVVSQTVSVTGLAGRNPYQNEPSGLVWAEGRPAAAAAISAARTLAACRLESWQCCRSPLWLSK